MSTAAEKLLQTKVLVMWLEPEKEYGKTSYVRAHQILGLNPEALGKENVTFIGQDVLVTWGRVKNSAWRARIKSIKSDKYRSRTKSEEGYHTHQKPAQMARRASEGGALSTSVPATSSQSCDDEERQPVSLESGDRLYKDSRTGYIKSKIQDIKYKDTGSDLDATLVQSTSPLEKSKSTSVCDSVFIDLTGPGSSDDDDATLNASTLKEQESRRHIDLRLRCLKDAEHKLDHCIRMVRGLFHVVPELNHRLPGKSLPKTSSRRPCTLSDVDERQMEFEKRAAVFYKVVRDIKELRRDPEFTRWISAAIRKFRD